MKHKRLLYIIATTLLLSSCSTTKLIVVESVEQSIDKTETKQLKESITIKTFDNCNKCSNPLELKAYFNSINYMKEAKNGSLILNTINPGLFKTQDVKLKKDMFFKSIYPIAYQANKEIKIERQDLILEKNIDQLMTKYKVDNIADLKIRLNVLPIPMIMAQAAIESAYGTSRFAEEGNALFGQWTTDPSGMTPREKPDSKWKVARFETPLDSARAYAINVNTHRTYIKLRGLRSKGLDPINGLDKYSQKGTEYIDIINSVIKSNNLNKYK
jgi:Bax protein